jgi:gluconate kinase
LKKLAECIDEWNAQGKGVVLACSALKRKYRSMLLGPNEKVRPNEPVPSRTRQC